MGESGDDEGPAKIDNATHFLDTDPSQWFLNCGQLCVANPLKSGGLWAEPHHQDGGGSVTQMVLTLYGRRDCVFEEVKGTGGMKAWLGKGCKLRSGPAGSGRTASDCWLPLLALPREQAPRTWCLGRGIAATPSKPKP